MLLLSVFEDAFRAEGLLVILTEELNLLARVGSAVGYRALDCRVAIVVCCCLLCGLSQQWKPGKYLVVYW